MDIPRKAPTFRRGKLVVVIGVLLLAGTGAAGAVWLEPKPPAVERSAIWTGRVERGSLAIQVKGTGTLVPEQVRWITSETSGRVETIFLKPGSAVTADQPIVQLENSDMRLQALLAERDAAATRSELIKLEHDAEVTALNERASGATLDSERDDVKRRASAYAQHPELLAPLDLQQLNDHANELERRSQLTEAKLGQLERGAARKLAAQRAQIARGDEVSRFRAKQLEELTVRAGSPGVLQDVLVEPGQWVVPGTVLAKVVVSSQLKAELRVPEVQAKDLGVGQSAIVDTHTGTVKAHVTRIATAAHEGTVKVELALEGELPQGARPDLSVDGQIDIDRLGDVLHLARPVGVQASSDAVLFRIDPHTGVATRLTVPIGKASVDAVEVRAALAEGDEIILSDMTRWSAFDSIVIK